MDDSVVMQVAHATKHLPPAADPWYRESLPIAAVVANLKLKLTWQWETIFVPVIYLSTTDEHDDFDRHCRISQAH